MDLHQARMTVLRLTGGPPLTFIYPQHPVLRHDGGFSLWTVSLPTADLILLVRDLRAQGIQIHEHTPEGARRDWDPQGKILLQLD